MGVVGCISSLRQAKGSAVAAIFMCLLVESLLTTVVIPVIPFYIEDLVTRGVFFASKVIVQFCFNPFVAWITSKIGRRKPILLGIGERFIIFRVAKAE